MQEKLAKMQAYEQQRQQGVAAQQNASAQLGNVYRDAAGQQIRSAADQSASGDDMRSAMAKAFLGGR